VPVYSKEGLFRKKRQTGVAMKEMLVNYYGLFKGYLLNGEEVINICKTIIGKLLCETFSKNKELFFRAIGVRPNHVMILNQFEAERIAEHLNMRQYYILTQEVEFTCTTVDLEDKILRFLNHKTTPFVPVCKAVQMTSAFPVAFKALEWKPEWGKYYIHYLTNRREIDLTGHQFTDGGVLANFPIKFLDNESVRPFYFSHGKTEKTRIFGFGLNKLNEAEDSEIAAKKEKMASEELR
jgi:predicted acylesterase/phospholipase RssA